MKKAFTFLMAFAIAAQTLATVTPSSAPTKPGPLKASEVFIPIAKGKIITLEDLAYMKPAEYTKLTGKQMKFFDRVGFKIAQKKLRSSINADGTINNMKMEKTFRKAIDGGGFHLGGAALGFFLGPIGVLIAYLLKDDLKPARVKWAWIGFAVGLLFWILIASVI